MIPVFERNLITVEMNLVSDAIQEEEWQIYNGVDANEAFESVNNHMNRRVIQYVAKSIKAEYTIYDNISIHLEPAVSMIEEYERHAFANGPKPNFDILDIFNYAQVGLTKISDEYRHIQENLQFNLKTDPNLHIPFRLITPYFEKSQTELLKWMTDILKGFADRQIAVLRTLGRDSEADGFRDVQISGTDFQRYSGFDRKFRDVFEADMQTEITTALNNGATYHDAVGNAEKRFSARVVEFVTFTINEEYKIYEDIHAEFVQSVALVEAYEKFAAGGQQPSFDLSEINFEIKTAVDKLAKRFQEIQNSLDKHVSEYELIQ
jgi:hypothetical protein